MSLFSCARRSQAGKVICFPESTSDRCHNFPSSSFCGTSFQVLPIIKDLTAEVQRKNSLSLLVFYLMNVLSLENPEASGIPLLFCADTAAPTCGDTFPFKWAFLIGGAKPCCACKLKSHPQKHGHSSDAFIYSFIPLYWEPKTRHCCCFSAGFYML